ncbi:MAG: DUF2937 family protein [Rhodobacteraceae bacterium]|nr:DUF2937 family protein [Paracoccaceae bacterium]
MVLRMLGLAGGVAGAAVLSQFPEFSQQYLQRLAGQVDALTLVTGDFDASAEKANLSREDALAAMSGTEFLGYRQDDMRRAFGRLERLSSDLTILREAGPVERIGMPQRFGDAETFAATWSDFAPAMPVTSSGAITAGVGFVGGWAGVAVVLSFLTAPFRRRRARHG